MSGLNPVDVVEEDAADLLFPKGLSIYLYCRKFLKKFKKIPKSKN